MTVAFEDLPGTALAGGSFTISAEENRRLEANLGAEPAADGTAHPLYAYLATQRGIGTSVSELLELAGFRLEDGPMLGSCELELRGPLRTGVRYAVSGTIVDIERKSGRRAGTFDLLTYREDLVDPEGQRAASATNTFVLRRTAA